jgi:hypothetical protein
VATAGHGGMFQARERELSGLVLGALRERGLRWICSCPGDATVRGARGTVGLRGGEYQAG